MELLNEKINNTIETVNNISNPPDIINLFMEMYEYINENLLPILKLDNDEWNLQALNIYIQTNEVICRKLYFTFNEYDKKDRKRLNKRLKILEYEIDKVCKMIITFLIKNKFCKSPLCPAYYSNQLINYRSNEMMCYYNKLFPTKY